MVIRIRPGIAASVLLLLAVLVVGMLSSARAELIVLASPSGDDDYYAEVEDAIFDFHVAYARAILAAGDDVLILTDRARLNDYVAELDRDHVAAAPQADIWMRDFSPSHAEHPRLFRYTAAGQGGGRKGQAQADAVQDELAALMQEAGILPPETDLKNDGGNFVEDRLGNVVVSTKFLADNSLTEARARRLLIALPGIEQVAFIEADEQGGLEHADGVVSFIDDGVLAVNAYPDDPDYAARLRTDLARGLPGVRIVEIPAPYDGSAIYDDRFGSACGLYTNALVTPDRVYLPQFGIKEDAQALARVQAHTSKQVIPVQSAGVCHMGGGVRCLSWQLRGDGARRFRELFSR